MVPSVGSMIRNRANKSYDTTISFMVYRSDQDLPMTSQPQSFRRHQFSHLVSAKISSFFHLSELRDQLTIVIVMSFSTGSRSGRYRVE